MRGIVPIATVRTNETLKDIAIPAGASAYFRYNIVPRVDNYFIHMLAEPGADKISMFANSDQLYPGPDNCQWQVPNRENEIFPDTGDFDPFTLDENNRITYNPAGLVANHHSRPAAASSSSLALMLEVDIWKYDARCCYICLRNETAAEVHAKIAVFGTARGIITRDGG